MAQAVRTPFPHRQNRDGSFDSICTQCFAAVATAATEAELKVAESAHDCKGFSLRPILHGTEHEGQANRSRQSTPVESQRA
jgi:hypothetical protein